MINEKIKIRISCFVSLIIDNDAQLWGFIKRDESTNKNAFLNKLIPNLLAIRKERREEIKNILKEDYQRANAEEIYESINTIIDKVYFRDEELDILSENIWIRPSKENISVFDEIETEELVITALDMSSYIRGLLNEYARLPQYKRQSIVFREENEIIEKAYESERVLCFRYDGERYRVYAYCPIYQYTLEQHSYLVAYDFDRDIVRSFFIERIENPFLLKKKVVLSQSVADALKYYCESERCDEYTVLMGVNKDEEN